jgi:hypothetical protein
MRPQDEAVSLLSRVVSELTNSSRDLKSLLRQCQHCCELIGYEPQKRLFYQELNGYHADSDLPEYRRIKCRLVWRPREQHPIARFNYDMDKILNKDDAVNPEQLTGVLEVRAGIDWFIKNSTSGYSEITGKTKRSDSVVYDQLKICNTLCIASSLSKIEQIIFDFASSAYVQLQYGNAIEDIWSDYRVCVDSALKDLGFIEHLQAINTGLQSTNPELWRLAVFGCRNLLKDIANLLWCDARSTYKYLPGDGVRGELKVTSDKFANRLSAYLHQKGMTGTRGKFIRVEAERLATSIQSLISLQSEAHDKIEITDVRSVALATYFILGELIIKTDMQPINEYTLPAVADS